jgi:micrococcal nuclease
MRLLHLVVAVVVGLVVGSTGVPVQAQTSQSALVSRIGAGAARLTTYNSGTGLLYVNLKGLTPGVWNEHLWSGTCASLGTRIAIFPGLIVPGSGALARTNPLTSPQAKGKTLRIVHGSEVLCTTFGMTVTPMAPTGPTQVALVVRVVDGDTIVIDRGYGPESLRYIGIDTPETVHPSEPVEWMGKEASDANRALVEGREVVLESDVSETDQYGRLIRYVWIRDGTSWTFVNLVLVAAGLAQVATYPPDVRYVDTYLAAQRTAQEHGLGLWAATPTPTATPSATAQPGNCDPSYPTVCIPPPPPDLDCGQIPYRRFQVVGSDPHRFDGDNDGIGCESG